MLNFLDEFLGAIFRFGLVVIGFILAFLALGLVPAIVLAIIYIVFKIKEY